MRTTVRAALAAAAAIAAAFAVAAAVAVILVPAAGADEAAKLVGSVKSVADDGSTFELKARPGTFQVSTGSAKLLAGRAIKLRDLADGMQVHILGKKQEPVRDPNTGRELPGQIVNVHAIVVDMGSGYAPPPLTREQEGHKLEWITGELNQEAKVVYSLHGRNVQIGNERPILELSKGQPAQIAKGKAVYVEGAPGGDAKARTLAATRVVVLAPEIGLGEYQAIFGF